MFLQYDDFDNDEKVIQNQKIDKYIGDRGGFCRDCLFGFKGEKGIFGQFGIFGIFGEIGRIGVKGEFGFRGDDGIFGFSGQRGESVRIRVNLILMVVLKIKFDIVNCSLRIFVNWCYRY